MDDNKDAVVVLVFDLPALVELRDGVLHLSEQAQRLQLPQLHLFHLLLQRRYVILIRQAAVLLDGEIFTTK